MVAATCISRRLERQPTSSPFGQCSARSRTRPPASISPNTTGVSRHRTAPGPTARAGGVEKELAGTSGSRSTSASSSSDNIRDSTGSGAPRGPMAPIWTIVKTSARARHVIDDDTPSRVGRRVGLVQLGRGGGRAADRADPARPRDIDRHRGRPARRQSNNVAPIRPGRRGRVGKKKPTHGREARIDGRGRRSRQSQPPRRASRRTGRDGGGAPSQWRCG